MTLEYGLKRDNNNFDLIRLVAALLVIFGHSFSVFMKNGHEEPISLFIKSEYSGSIAVYIFFFLSGIFITSSFINSTTLVRFLLMRFFRLWPALIVCILLTVFIIGPICTNIPLAEYFKSTQTWKYLIKNLTMLPDSEMKLSGVFDKNHFTEGVNASLWTLPTEIKCYFLIFVFGCIGLLKKSYGPVLIFLMVLFVYFTRDFYRIHYLTLSIYVRHIAFFMAGGAAYSLRKYIIIDYRIAIAFLVLCVAFYNTAFFLAAFYITLCYLILYCGMSGVAKKIRMPGDYSYGLYLYGFLVQQTVAYFWPSLNCYTSLLIVLPMSFLVAVFSWHVVEGPANKLARRLSKRYDETYGVSVKDRLIKAKLTQAY
jgi:peptidoglycan/LPS O-acetylase OafA/YrhL